MNTRKHSTEKILVPVGEKYGMLVVLNESERRRTSAGGFVRVFSCLCECGTKTNVGLANLRRGMTLSCGCLRKKRAAEASREMLTTHGQSKTPMYRLWWGMIGRCHKEKNKSYLLYGARGILVCQQWREDFAAFSGYMGIRPQGMTLERINNDVGYEPGNVRWATRKEQARNTRRNHMYTMNGETRCLVEWCEITGEKLSSVRKRIAAGHDPFVRIRLSGRSQK